MRIEDLYRLFQQTKGVCTDSRKAGSGSIFFALRGENFNGNDYALQALENGCALAVVDEKPGKHDERIIVVPDVLQHLQEMARFHRRKMNLPVIGITGSNGKTTTKELIKQILGTKFTVTSTRGNLNNHIGVPLTVLDINEATDIAVIEMGANHVGEIDLLSGISMPTHGIITNIGNAHLEGFGSPGMVIRAKNELYEYLRQNGGEVFVNCDDPLLMELTCDLKRTTFGKLPEAGMIARDTSEVFSSLEWKIPHQVSEWQKVSTKLVGSYNFYNVVSAIAVGHYFGIDHRLINQSLAEFEPGPNRSQYTETADNRLIMDAYNANPDSMKAALQNFAGMKSGNKVVILGDMFELGEFSQAAHQEIVRELEESELEEVYLVGEEFYKQSGTSCFRFFPDLDSFINYLEGHQLKGKLILLKGSRGMKLERLADYL